MPRFSIVIPSYGHVDYLPSCLDSLRGQTFADWEAVVVDDASTDGSNEVAGRYACEDGRFHVIAKADNEGRHLARRTGVEHAQGDYVLFLDADDRLEDDDVLRLLAEALEERPVDILRFALRVELVCGTPESAGRGFEAWCNAPCEDLRGEEVVSAAFGEREGFRVPWHVTHRALRREVVAAAFAAMSDERLSRAEDAYEYFVIASLAREEASRCDIVGYHYNMGTGVTNVGTMSTETFAREARETAACARAALAYAESFDGYDMRPYAADFRHRLMETLGNNWNERVPTSDKPAAADCFAREAGELAVDRELWRFVRDRAYELLATNAQPAEDDVLHVLSRLARDHYLPQGQPDDDVRRVREMRDVAESHLGDLRDMVALSARWESQSVRVFVAAHKPVDLFESAVLQPIQVGSARAASRFRRMLHDDEGENISERNSQYCELTAQYWAWKNVDADYLGFCHYRRYFDFSDDRHEENPFGEVLDEYIDAETQARYALDDASIIEAVRGYDVITTCFKDLREFPGDFATPLEQYEASPCLHVRDLRHVMDILVERHPDYQPDVDAFLNGHTSCFCNMFIMRRDLFRDYCSWLFPLLEEFVATTDMTGYSREALRTPGHLAERLFNVYYLHHMRTEAGWRTRQLQCVHFGHPDETTDVVEPMVADGRPVVPVAFAADDAYVPMVTTTLYSMMKNASRDRNYDVVIIERGISHQNKQEMTRFFSQFENMRLSFADAGHMVSGYHLTTNNPHIGVETYYRFLIQQILPAYDKVLYLDSDLIVVGDVAELFDTDLGDDLLAAVHDVDYLGNLNMNDGIRYRYTTEVMGMRDPFLYFQAGVLVLNTAAMRATYEIEKWLEFASDSRLIFNDQDVLNARCEGRVHYLDWSWNVMNNCFGRVEKVFPFAPAWAYEAYLLSAASPRVVHYAGAEKPWTNPDCDRSELFWSYARETPFYERLMARLAGEVAARRLAESGRADIFVHEPALSENSGLRRVFDPLMPMGSNRREVAKALARFLRGRK